jgi:hypothetical protein
MSPLAFLSLPGGAEWLCILVFLGLIVGTVVLAVYLVKGRAAPPAFMPRICHVCGRGNLADARFCSYCGRELTPPTTGPNM